MKKYNLRDEYDYKNYWQGSLFKWLTILIQLHLTLLGIGVLLSIGYIIRLLW